MNKQEGFCYCKIGAGGKPCISREHCDAQNECTHEEDGSSMIADCYYGSGGTYCQGCLAFFPAATKQKYTMDFVEGWHRIINTENGGVIGRSDVKEPLRSWMDHLNSAESGQ